MTAFVTLLHTEALKLRRSLALLLCAAAPLCVAGFAALALATAKAPKSWDRFLDEGLAMWTFFMLPMAVTALTILVAQVEHGPRMWNHVLTLPVRRASLFLAKLAITLTLVVVMQLLVYVFLYAAGLAVSAVLPDRQPTGDMVLRGMAVGMSAMTLGALALVVVQLWAALRLRSFVPPLVLGIAGTFAALVFTAAGADVYLPWLLPVYATMWPKLAALWGVGLGLGLGVVLAAAMIADLSRREAL
jgi:hypothetical protein